MKFRANIVLCDHTKIKNSAFMSICSLDAIDLIIMGNESDKGPTKQMIETGIGVESV